MPKVPAADMPDEGEMGTPIVINSARDYAIRHGRLKKEEMEIRTKFKDRSVGCVRMVTSSEVTKIKLEALTYVSPN